MIARAGHFRTFLANRSARIGTVIVSIVLLAIIFGPFASPYSPVAMNFGALLKPPSLVHPFGTDAFGRDVLTRVLYGGRVSFLVSLLGVLLATVVGSVAGMISAYHGGLIDMMLMRVSDLLFAFPSFVLALFLMVVLGFGVENVIFAIALVYLPIFARLSRNTALVIREEPFIQAARLMGQSPLRILFGEILPNIAAPLVVQATIGLAFGIVIEAGLSFLGLGVQPPTPSLGVIMADGREYFQRAPWVLTLTGLAISIALLGLNLLGDGLRDMTDPRLRQGTER